MRFAGEHLTDNDTFEATLDGLYLLHAACLQSYRGERSGYLVGSEGKIDIFFKPIVRNIHIALYLLLFFFYQIEISCKITKRYWQ